jgi:hypothetical protein
MHGQCRMSTPPGSLTIAVRVRAVTTWLVISRSRLQYRSSFGLAAGCGRVSPRSQLGHERSGPPRRRTAQSFPEHRVRCHRASYSEIREMCRRQPLAHAKRVAGTAPPTATCSGSAGARLRVPHDVCRDAGEGCFLARGRASCAWRAVAIQRRLRLPGPEPPPWLLFCIPEPKRLPATVLNRSQMRRSKRLSGRSRRYSQSFCAPLQPTKYGSEIP